MKEEARLTPQFWLDQRVEGGSMYKLERLGGSWPGWGDEGEFSLGHVELGEAGRQAGTGGVWAKACSGNRDADSGLVAVHGDCDHTGGKVWSKRRRGPEECTVQDHLRTQR